MVEPLLAVSAGLALGLLATYFAGESPLNILGILFRSAFGSVYDFGMTLFYMTPLVFTGLSVAVAFQAGLFNIGAEGQLAWGALAAVMVGLFLPDLPWPLGPILAVIAAVTAGAIWGAIPGWLRAKRGSHEVINTIMLNFVAAGLTSWITLDWLKDPNSQNPESRAVSASYLWHPWEMFQEAPVSAALILALVCAAIVHFFLKRSVFGFNVRALGQSEPAAAMAGIDVARTRILAMAVAGGLAGLAGLGDIFTTSGTFRIGFSPGFGFTGIAVALLGRSKPIGVIAAAFLFAALHKGAGDLDFETEFVTRDLSQILQACVILVVSADGLWSWIRRLRAASPITVSTTLTTGSGV